MRASRSCFVAFVLAFWGCTPSRGLTTLPAGAQENPGQYVVRANSGVTPAQMRELVEPRGGKVERLIDGINSYVISVPVDGQAVLAGLQGDSRLLDATDDFLVSPARAVGNSSYSTDYTFLKTRVTDFFPLWTNTDVYGSVVAVIDSGYDATQPGAGFVNGYQSSIRGFWSLVDSEPTFTDESGHGTAVASIIASSSTDPGTVGGICPFCTVLSVKVTDQRGLAPESRVAQAIIWAADHGARVINVSMAPLVGRPVISAAVKYAASRDALVVLAAGNGLVPVTYLNAAEPNLLWVSATDASDQIAAFSFRGPAMISAPGVGILSTALKESGSGGYARLDGTSFSAAVVSGVAALLFNQEGHSTIGDPVVNARMVAEAIRRGADDLGTPGQDPVYGYGRINIVKAYQVLQDLLAQGATPSRITDWPELSVSPIGPGVMQLTDFVAYPGVSFSTAGMYEIRFNSWATPDQQGGWPEIEIQVDGVSAGSLPIDAPEVVSRQFLVSVPQGLHRIELRNKSELYPASSRAAFLGTTSILPAP